MKTLLANLYFFITIGMIVIMYFWLMNWSVKWFVNFKITRKCRKDEFREIRPTYIWQEIVSIPVYILTWTPVIAIVVALIGGFFYVLHDLFMAMLALISVNS